MKFQKPSSIDLITLVERSGNRLGILSRLGDKILGRLVPQSEAHAACLPLLCYEYCSIQNCWDFWIGCSPCIIEVKGVYSYSRLGCDLGDTCTSKNRCAFGC